MVNAAATDDLEWIPRSLRDKLDQVGVKLHLREWQMLSLADRHQLYDLPTGTEAQAQIFLQLLIELVEAAGGRRPEPLPRNP